MQIPPCPPGKLSITGSTGVHISLTGGIRTLYRPEIKRQVRTTSPALQPRLLSCSANGTGELALF